jgi:hypothetical protein
MGELSFRLEKRNIYFEVVVSKMYEKMKAISKTANAQDF